MSRRGDVREEESCWLAARICCELVLHAVYYHYTPTTSTGVVVGKWGFEKDRPA